MHNRVFSIIPGQYPQDAWRPLPTRCDNPNVSRRCRITCGPKSTQIALVFLCDKQPQREVWISVGKMLPLMSNLCNMEVWVHIGQETLPEILREGCSCLGNVTKLFYDRVQVIQLFWASGPFFCKTEWLDSFNIWILEELSGWQWGTSIWKLLLFGEK